MKTLTHTYDSLQAFADFAAGGDQNDSSRVSRQTTDIYGKGWFGTETFAEASALVREGWSEPRADVLALTGAIVTDAMASVDAMRMRAHFDFTGSEVDMGRFVTGEPENMVDYRMTAEQSFDRVFTLVVSIGVSAGISPEKIRARGAAIMALVDVLGQCGISTEIYAEHVCEAGSQKISNMIKVKSSDADTDLDTVMYAVAHPSMVRRMVFSAQERESEAVRNRFGFNTMGGYGRPRDAMRGDDVNAQIVLPIIGYGNDEITNPVQWIQQTLDTYTGAQA